MTAPHQSARTVSFYATDNNFTERLLATRSLLSVDTDEARIASVRNIESQPFQPGQLVQREGGRGTRRHARTLSRARFIRARSLHRRAMHRDLPIVVAGFTRVKACVFVFARASVITWVRCFSTSSVERRGATLSRRTCIERSPLRRDIYVSDNVSDCPHAHVRARAQIYTHIHIYVSIPAVSTPADPHGGEDNGDPIATRPLAAFTARAHDRYRARWFRNS